MSGDHNQYQKGRKHEGCADCKRYQLSAQMWRNEAYKHAGIELPWKPEELLQQEYERGFEDGQRSARNEKEKSGG